MLLFLHHNQGMSSSLFVADQARAAVIERMAGLERLEQSGANVIHGEKSGIFIKHLPELLFVLQGSGIALVEVKHYMEHGKNSFPCNMTRLPFLGMGPLTTRPE